MTEPSTVTPTRSQHAHARLGAVLLVLVLLVTASLACSIGGSLSGGNSGPTATKTRRATFTPLPGALTTPSTSAAVVRGTLPPGVTIEPGEHATPSEGSTSGTPGAATVGETSLLLYATDTPTPSPTPTEGAVTVTATGSTVPDLRGQPTPYAVIKPATLNGRRGPGTQYEKIGEAKNGEELFVLGRTADGTWLQVCCMANQPVWVQADQVDTRNSIEVVAILTPPAVPLPTPTRRPVTAVPRTGQSPLATPRVATTPLPPFDVARGPEFPWAVNNGIMNIFVKVYEGPVDNQKPLGGYILVVKRDGVDISKDLQSFADRPFDNTGTKQGNYDYNLKFELYDASESDYEIYLARPGGFRVSPVSKFTTKGSSYRNLIVFIAYWLAR